MALNGYVSVKRLIFLGSLTALVFLIIISAYARHMLFKGPDEDTPRISLERGSILDRNGKILAVETTLYNIAITRSAIADKPLFAELLAPAVGLEKADLLARLEGTGSDFFYLKKKISEGEKETIEEIVHDSRLRGIRLEPVMSRTYPENNLASHIVGFLGDDGKGLTGVEYSFQDILSTEGDGGKGIPYNVMLTIDGNIQYELEKIAAKAMDDTKAEAVMMIAADAHSGEILAYISEPSANLNGFTRESDTARFDRPALYAYEPGSVFKIFSIAALLDMGAVRDRDSFLCDGAYTFTTPRGERVNIKCLEHHGWVTPRDIIKYSCNDGTAQIAEKASAPAFEAKLRAFGFGAKTGVELPGETTGLFYPSASWSLRSKPTIAIGQEISVSALQMVEASTALANGGKRVKLTLLSKLFTPEGAVAYEHVPKELDQVVSAETASLMLSYMETTSESGTGTRASVGDVPMAVKTGTAQMLNAEKNGYSDTDYISSCIGIFPANDPSVILYIAIVKPVGESYGGRIAAPVISTAANAIIDYLGIGRAKATSVRHTGIIPVQGNKAAEIGNVMPDLTGVSKRMLTPLLSRDDITVIIDGDGYVVSQTPDPGTPIEKGMTVELRLE
ncbi:MAG TPA: penicillin-binding protein [Treponemataceae bacterium]|nr:penicillin-binding protein [Treponemataceae bacterium]